MTISSEIVLFHVDPPHPPPLHFTDIPHRVLFELCVRSIRHYSPSSRIVLLTDETTQIAAACPDVECIRHFGIRTEWMMYERSRLYLEHVIRRHKEGSARGIVLMDTDIVVARDLSEIFALAFDAGLTVRHVPGTELDDFGVPRNTGAASPINGGVVFAKPTQGAVSFFTEQMRMYDHLHEHAHLSFGAAVSDIRSWGGDQFALMAMVGRQLLQQAPQTLEHRGALVRFFDCDRYNFSPELNGSATVDYLRTKYIIHMKGPRKNFMPALAHALGIS